jgi:hypothetical protein
MHGAVWTSFDPAAGYQPPAGKPLILASYCRGGGLTDAYVEPVGPGDMLQDMPLFLDCGHYVSVPLERTYLKAYSGMPAIWREVLEGSPDQPH